MAEQFQELEQKHIEFIKAQHMFFVGTAGARGFVNVSPKGMDTLRVVDPSQVVWLNLTGSGNESAAHVLENQRMTIMFCSFTAQPMIMRLYGEAEVIHPRDVAWQELMTLFPDQPGARQIFRLKVRLVQTSCGYAVPHYEFQDDRVTLRKWAENKGPDGIAKYWANQNVASLDGYETGISGK